ncbi:electron transport complex subunit RsxB [Hydrogenovibrio sp. SC-1]|uniref:electron transport complex subunit RsxB n=1 Tax=Hydrogenovibrio sp. SC-1 TaxID=2065820 RepID=UPI000C7C501E|nr:electron transport complex subunit RsxB [Hydrogenovibrio sp. SC-1]PLA74932.1 electron transport complex subunit RsxB [Hydrogenovibrio sp. SC-1]
MIAALIIFLVMAILFGLLQGYASVRFKVEGNPLAEQINQLLPQTQCGQCGFPGCKPYAEALAEGESEVNLCIPGGHKTMIEIAEITHREPKEMAETAPTSQQKLVAKIDESICIGCVHCIKVCPVDAILGATKKMHTVIEQECTGCELCVPVCPVDCVEMVAEPVTLHNWSWPEPSQQTRGRLNRYDSTENAHLLLNKSTKGES